MERRTFLGLLGSAFAALATGLELKPHLPQPWTFAPVIHQSWGEGIIRLNPNSVYHVPGNFETLAEACEAAGPGDTVWFLADKP